MRSRVFQLGFHVKTIYDTDVQLQTGTVSLQPEVSAGSRSMFLDSAILRCRCAVANQGPKVRGVERKDLLRELLRYGRKSKNGCRTYASSYLERDRSAGVKCSLQRAQPVEGRCQT